MRLSSRDFYDKKRALALPSFFFNLYKGNKKDANSEVCRNEIATSGNEFCQYWQTCDFKAVKGKNCDVIASRVVALVIPIVILLLTTAIFAIYCFKKKADKAEEANKEINDRLPQIGVQDSTRSNGKGKSIIPSLSKSNKDGSLKKSEYNEIAINATPGKRQIHDSNL